MTTDPTPTDWHRRPPRTTGPCPVCGCPVARPGEHRRVDDPGAVLPNRVQRKRKIPFEAGTPGEDFVISVQNRHIVNVRVTGIPVQDVFDGIVFHEEMPDVRFQDLRSGVKLFPDQIFNPMPDESPIDARKNQENGDNPQEREIKKQEKLFPSQAGYLFRLLRCRPRPPLQLGNPCLSRTAVISPCHVTRRAITSAWSARFESEPVTCRLSPL